MNMITLKKSTDLWFIAFLQSKGFKINNFNVITRGKIEASFDIADQEWLQLKLEFHNSELVKFKQLIEQLKDLGY